MKHLLILAFLWLSASLHAQTGDSLFLPKLTGEMYVPEARHIGEIFFNSNWTESEILLSSGDTVSGEKINYHGYQDEVIWYNPSNFTPFVLDKAHIRAFWTTDNLGNPVHFKNLQVRDSTYSSPKCIFAQVAVEGRYSLYIQRRIISLPDEVVNGKNGPYFQKAYDKSPIYYIKLSSGQFLVLKQLSRQGFLNLFPAQKDALSALIRKNGIRLRTETGLIKVVRLMNL